MPQLMAGSSNHKDAELVRQFYEDSVEDQRNPVWASLARQYASCVNAAETCNLLLQNINPLIAVLKAIELGLLDSRLRMTGVIHDSAGSLGRFRYLARRVMATRRSQLSLIAVSESVRTALCEAGVPAERVRKVVNGMDIEPFSRRIQRMRSEDTFSVVRQRNRVPSDKKIVLMSARRVPWKGHVDLIHAVTQLVSAGDFDNSCVVINGAGLQDSRSMGYDSELRQLISGLHLTDTVFLLDQLTQDEVAACYAAAHVAVLPSREPEPFGYANIEAMLAGVPVVATAHGGPLEYITDSVSGLLIPPDHPAALATALRRLLRDPDLHDRIGSAGRASARRFTLDAMVDGYEAVIRSQTVGTIERGITR
ncbi:glycosyltransferase family 4 protein [Nocardia sp. NPDC050697]|uniref:glycosyltransferase family 4 protein n=1 Tax=Nocardia sp. NPDC050697 TaxID=3155158 RepID=UPI0033D3BC1C